MFDISFAELMMIAVVGLLVIGPDKLPQVARTLGAYVGRVQRYVAQVKEEVNREARFEDLQSLQQEIKKGAEQAGFSIMDGAQEVKQAVTTIEKAVQAEQKTTQVPVKKKAVKKVAPKKVTTKKPAVKKATVKQKVEKA